ncbi:hypothetical protein ABH15_11700 [Methanoculleus taiwanensis]|uniref:FTP domain-containing protein n=1 Tax=Methanoculleus taiwanensis TaxID=1550565 RepID=A0A498GZ57_9EURY|nr:hypothetical protein [Methanoculleus taiwanensis]RXE55404.1 hypothetical protein ABH15_11700 [Methanoculleus taiwanensis]
MKRKALLTGFTVIVLGIIVVGAVDIPLLPNIVGSSGLYVLAAPFPDVNDSYPVYRTVPPDTSTEEIRRIGNLFGVSGDVRGPRTSSGEAKIVDDSKGSAEIFYYYTNSGAFRYSIPDKEYPNTPDRQPDLPSDEEARVIAVTYLKERGFLPEDVHVEGVRIGCSYESSTLTSQTVYTLTKQVSFFKEIQGLQVYHAGVGATIGENGEVVSAGSSLREFDPKPVHDVKIVTPEQAYQRLSSGNVMIQPLPWEYDKIVVTNISLGYWMETKTEPQKYIVPVYVFSCTATWNGKSEEVVRYVPAVDLSEMQYLT